MVAQRDSKESKGPPRAAIDIRRQMGGAQFFHIPAQCEEEPAEPARKSDLLGSENAMNFWRTSQNFVLPFWLDGEGRRQRGTVENSP